MKNRNKHNVMRSAPVLAAICLAACATDNSLGANSNAMAKVDLRVSTTSSPNEIYEARSEFTVPGFVYSVASRRDLGRRRNGEC